MKKGNGIQDLKDFKKKLKYNTIYHLIILIVFTPSFIINFNQMSLLLILNYFSISIIQIYCIMLHIII